MSNELLDRLARWSTAAGIAPWRLPDRRALEEFARRAPRPCRPAASHDELDAWEHRHGYALPDTLRRWLELSNGLYLTGPVIHPLSAIGPMVPFARMPQLVVQPESWFELGNPNVETVCIDLGYRWPGGGHPIFTSGDDESGSPPRVIATSFEEWFLELLRRGGREYWFDPGFEPLGHPWDAHREFAPEPPLPARLLPLAGRALPLMRDGADELAVASALGISRGEVETLFRHLQHGGSRDG